MISPYVLSLLCLGTALPGCASAGSSTQNSPPSKSASTVANVLSKSQAEVESLLGKGMKIKGPDGEDMFVYKTSGLKGVQVDYDDSGEQMSATEVHGKVQRASFLFSKPTKDWKEAIAALGLKPDGVTTLPNFKLYGYLPTGTLLKGLKGVPDYYIPNYFVDKNGTPTLRFQYWGDDFPQDVTAWYWKGTGKNGG